MSLINKVLRDLDARHAAAAQRALPNEVRPLPAGDAESSARMPLLIGLLAVAGAGAWGAWTYLSAPTPTAISAPVAPPVAIAAPAAETPALPMLVIAPPAPPAEAAVVPSAASTPLPADNSTSVPVQVSSLQLSTTLRPPAAAAPPATRIDKQVHDDAHERAEAAYRAGLAAQRQGRGAEAVASLRQALQEEPRNANARQLLLSVLVERQLWPEAESALREGLELTPANGGWAMALARIQVERGEADQAWATLQKYMAAGADNADFQGFAGVLLHRLQRPAEAVAHYQAALRLKPDARWWAGLGLALEAAGRASEAREAFQRAQAAGSLAPEMAVVVERHLK
jgi:MSHA biogenesis protein MshN